MKKIVFNIFSLLFFLTATLCAFSCNSYNSYEITPQDHDVVLILIKNDGTKVQKTLTTQRHGATIYAPNDYKIYPSLVNEYVVVNDNWYLSESMSSPVYFPYTMPDSDLKFYASVRPLTNFNDVKFIEASTVHTYFSSNTTLQDESWSMPDENSESSYYEISEYSVASIKNVMRYYPATQKLVLLRGYSQSENISDLVIIQDEFSIGISINFINNTVECKGIYSRTGVSSSSVSGGGSVIITFNVNKISIDNTAQPLFPNFATIDYTYTISDATNYSKMQELWRSDGYDYAKKCYSQANTLLKSINKRILIFS